MQNPAAAAILSKNIFLLKMSDLYFGKILLKREKKGNINNNILEFSVKYVSLGLVPSDMVYIDHPELWIQCILIRILDA